jgi:heat shock protein HtpX
MNNTIKTALFLGLLTGILLGIGSFWGYTGLVIGLVVAVCMNFYAYFFSDRVVLRMYSAKEVKQSEYPELFSMVKDVAQLADVPMPKLYVIDSSNPNAFATGRNPSHAAVAVTRGILDLLDKSELKGVIAHEISHVKNRDILIGSVAATIAGVISFAATMAQWGAIFGGFGSRDGDNGNIVSLLVLAIVTPIMASLIQLAISRSREYQADESAAKILQNPHGLVNALEKLEIGVRKSPMRVQSQAGASMFIVNPFSKKNFSKMMSTHPTTEDRVNRLKSLRL